MTPSFPFRWHTPPWVSEEQDHGPRLLDEETRDTTERPEQNTGLRGGAVAERVAETA
jgi:hypothetical protein